MRISSLLACALLLPALPHPAQAATCPPAGDPNVTVTIDTGPLQFDRTKSINQLITISQGMTGGNTVNMSEHVPLGLTAAKFETRYQVEAHVIESPDGSGCATLSKLTVQLLQPETTVYIARELPGGSCISHEVETHENKHVAVNNAILRDYQMRISNEIRPALRNIGPVRVNNSQAGINSISAKVQPLLDAALERMNRERLRRQAMIDTPQEYERVARSCNREAQRYIRQSRNNR